MKGDVIKYRITTTHGAVARIDLKPPSDIISTEWIDYIYIYNLETSTGVLLADQQDFSLIL